MSKPNLRENMLVGMGNPLLDISSQVGIEFLQKYGLKENQAILATEGHKDLYNELLNSHVVEFIAGGSVQNALRVAQWLLETPRLTTFFGSVGKDMYAEILEKKARQDGVNVNYQYHPTEATGTCAVLVTDTHRTLCANLAAANQFTVDHIEKPENRNLIESAQFYYVSGFFLTVSPPSILKVAKYALSQNKPFLMNLSADYISTMFKEQLMSALPYVDVLFGNEVEAAAFAEVNKFETKDMKQIALTICKLPKENLDRPRVCVITQGTSPVILAQNGESQEFPVAALPKEMLMDTNGAGDAFVGGFLSQYIQGRSLDICVKCGIWAAGQIVQRSGCTYTGKADFRL